MIAMARVVLASALSRWLPPQQAADQREVALDVDAGDVRSALDAVFDRFPTLRGYVLDEHGAVRHHVAVFVDGRSLRDKRNLAQPLDADAEVHVIQALSGG